MTRVPPTNQPQTSLLAKLTVGGPKIAGPTNAAIEAIDKLRSGVTQANQIPADLNIGFWAQIKTAAVDANGIACYQFVPVLEYEPGLWCNAPQTDGDPTPGVYAYELNNFFDVPIESRVWMRANGYSTSMTGDQLYIFEYGQQGFWARLHDASGFNYQFTQVVEGPAGTWTDLTNGIASTTANGVTAQEVNATTGIASGTRVWIIGQVGPDTRLYAFVVGGTNSSPLDGALFAVRVTYASGSNGTVSTPAAYLYNLKDVTNTTSIGSSIPVTRPRPNGSMIYQAGSDGYGLAFFDGTTLILWDAGEVQDTSSCP